LFITVFAIIGMILTISSKTIFQLQIIFTHSTDSSLNCFWIYFCSHIGPSVLYHY